MKAYQITEKLESGKKYLYALFSDLHIDSKHCNIKLLKSSLEWCKKNNARILINGDTFDAILLRDMKRATNSRMEVEDGQLNVKMKRVVELFKPYVNNICFIGTGNHEISVMKFNGVDILDWLICELNHYKTNGVIAKGDYQSFIRIGFSYTEKKQQYRLIYDIIAHHGSGATASVTKGMIDFARLTQSTLADLYWIGHKHNSIIDPSIPLKMITVNGNIITKNRKAIMTPSFTDQIFTTDGINFEDTFYVVQAKSGFGLLTLTPKRPHQEEGFLEVDLNMITDGKIEQVYGKLQEI